MNVEDLARDALRYKANYEYERTDPDGERWSTNGLQPTGRPRGTKGDTMRGGHTHGVVQDDSRTQDGTASRASLQVDVDGYDQEVQGECSRSSATDDL